MVDLFDANERLIKIKEFNFDVIFWQLSAKKVSFQSSRSKNNTCVFFCWRLLGYVPGGAPFGQLNIGVKDAMAISTKRCNTSSKH